MQKISEFHTKSTGRDHLIPRQFGRLIKCGRGESSQDGSKIIVELSSANRKQPEAFVNLLKEDQSLVTSTPTKQI